MDQILCRVSTNLKHRDIIGYAAVVADRILALGATSNNFRGMLFKLKQNLTTRQGGLESIIIAT